MTFALISVLSDWITWPLIALIIVIFAIWRKDHVRAAIKLKRFQFSLEAKDLRLKGRATKFK
jgi:hypothetical protein